MPRLDPAPSAAAAAAEPPIVTTAWLVRLRWAAVAAAFASWALARFALGLDVPAAEALAILGAMAASNLVLARRDAAHAATPVSVLGAAIGLDVALVTALLVVSGGPSNPFTVVYLVYITLAAVTLGSRWTWTITALAMVGYASLFLFSREDAHAAHTATPAALTSHLVGMWVAFLAAAVLIAFFVTRIRDALRRREEALAEARRAAAHQERLAALTTLAAGAAHELATPLATIAVASRELQRAAEAEALPPIWGEDARLIRQQVDRCQLILTQMSGRADETLFDDPARIDPRTVLEEALRVLPPQTGARVRLAPDTDLGPLALPPQGLARALAALIKNALDASPEDAPVEVAFDAARGVAAVSVRDYGTGMPDHVLARAGEPFFTTKSPGRGFGLGLFLVRVFAERWGGQVRLRPAEGGGTEARLEFPTR